MEQRNDPSTAEIVRELKEEATLVLCGEDSSMNLDLIGTVIRRLEQLERELDESYQDNCNTQALLDLATARAEKAEAEAEDARQRGYEEGMDEVRHQYEEDGYV